MMNNPKIFRDQPCFKLLRVNSNGSDASFHSGPESFSSLCSEGLGSLVSHCASISTKLAASFGAALSLPNDDASNTSPSAPKHDTQLVNPSPFAPSTVMDFQWLRERCDGSDEIVAEVLKSFCEQGHFHICGLRRFSKCGDLNMLSFHADFISGSACNVGARELEQSSQALLLAVAEAQANALETWNVDSLIDQVELCFAACLGAIASLVISPCVDMNCRAVSDSDQIENFLSSTQKHFCDIHKPHIKQSCPVTSDGFPSSVDLEQPVHADSQAVEMAALFRLIRRRVSRLKQYNRAGRTREARKQAALVVTAAAAGGCRRIASRASRLLWLNGHVSADALEDLVVQIDSAEALWNSCRCVV